MHPLKIWSFRGRIGRLAYLGGNLLLVPWLAAMIAGIVYLNQGRMAGEPPTLAKLVLGYTILPGWVLFWWALLALMAKRLHDAGKSAWWLLSVIFPPVGGFLLLYLQIRPGDDHDNAYGPVQRKAGHLPQPSRT